MFSKTLLKTKLQYVDKEVPGSEAINHMVKTLNSTYQDNTPKLTDLGEVSVSSYSYSSGNLNTTITIPHSLGVTPSGFLVLYNKPSSVNVGDLYFFTLVSMDIGTITIRVHGGLIGAVTGEYKFLILR